MAAVFVKALLAASFLCLFFAVGDASFSKVASMTSSMIDRLFNEQVRVRKEIFGNGKGEKARHKRDKEQEDKSEPISKTLDDPKGCLMRCRSNETQDLAVAMAENKRRLVEFARKQMENNSTIALNPDDDEFQKHYMILIIHEMGPMFDDYCAVHKTTAACYSKCPESQARSVMVADNEELTGTFCEPGQYWTNFPEYWTALNCTDELDSDPCEKKCGPELDLRMETKLEVNANDDIFGELDFSDDDDDNSNDDKKKFDTIQVSYETDPKKNTAATNRVCKNIACEIDCYKPMVTKTCGAKAYDMYVRLQTLGVHSPLGILKALKAIDKVEECKQFA